MKPQSDEEKLFSFSLPKDFLPTLNYIMEVNVNSSGWMFNSLCEGIWKVGYINGRVIEEELHYEIFSVLMATR